jgi:molybdopterin-guanine dinucleotide biosynthesis protein A
MSKTAAILVGGRARRLGGLDKSAVRVGGRAILARQIAALVGVADRIVLVGTATAPAGLPAPVDAIPDARPDHGSLGGLYTALVAAGGPVLVLACDMPFVTAPFLAHLLEAAPDADAVVPRDAGGLHPLCAVYRPGCLPAFEQALAAGRLTIVDVLPSVRVHEIGPDEVRRFDPDGVLLMNVNRPEDLARADARAAGAGT